MRYSIAMVPVAILQLPAARHDRLTSIRRGCFTLSDTQTLSPRDGVFLFVGVRCGLSLFKASVVLTVTLIRHMLFTWYGSAVSGPVEGLDAGTESIVAGRRELGFCL
jgi:hypothetical protein